MRISHIVGFTSANKKETLHATGQSLLALVVLPVQWTPTLLNLAYLKLQLFTTMTHTSKAVRVRHSQLGLGLGLQGR